MNEKPVVSVIVPVYHCAQWLPGCVESVLAQTRTDFALILVDDGSTDGSGEICDRYGEQDPRVRVIHQENGGAAAARNRGILEATGTWVVFVDGDDTLAPDYLERLLAEPEADVAVCGMAILYEAVRPPYTVEKVLGLLSGQVSPAEAYRASEAAGLFNSSCNKRYRLDLLREHKIRFRDGYAEDLLFNLDYFGCVATAAVVAQPLYRYHKREAESLVTRYYPEMPARAKECGDRRRALFEQLGLATPADRALLAVLCCDYRWLCVPNAYRRGAAETGKTRRALMKSLLEDRELARQMEDFIPENRYHRIFRRLYRLGSPGTMKLAYDLLFFFRNRLSGFYLSIRKGLMGH